MEVQVEAIVHATEDSEKVKLAMLNIFPELKLEGSGERLTGWGDSLENFKRLLEKQRIRDSAKTVLFKYAGKNELKFRLNKQAAFVGKLSFSEEEHPLGEIEVCIRTENLSALITYLTEK